MQPVAAKKAPFMTHVNGLRAVAILGILFYHLNSAYCPAGYFGVDVFLVISGYFLLASLLKAERAGDVHYGSYLLKKSWRILPSWLVVTLVFCIGSAWYMIPPDRVEICNTALRSAYFGADFFIDRLYDYFNQKAHQNLFLHYWYLSITCQMYILIPLVVMLMLRFFSRRAAGLALGVIGLLSLTLYILVTAMQVPESVRQTLLAATGMKTAYYHLLPRLWEVLAGGVVLLLPAWTERRRLRMLLETLAIVGMVASFFCYETGSAQVYLAAVSAVLFIRYGGEGPLSRLLSWRPLQWVGTISFSLYLWHWPIMASWKYVKLGEITWADELGMILLSLALAALAWRLIESLRMPKSPSRLMLVVRLLPVLLLVGFICGIRPYYKGIQRSAFDGFVGQGLLKEIIRGTDAQPKDAALLRGHSPELFKRLPSYIGEDAAIAPSFILMGDSHSDHSYPGLHRACSENGLRGIALNDNVIPFWWCYKEGAWNENKAEALLEYIRQQPSVRYVFVVLLWQNRLCGSANDNAGATLDWREMKSLNTEEQIALRVKGLEETCRRFTEMGLKVVLLADVPLLPPDLSPYQLALKSKMLRGEDAPEYLVPVEKHQRDSARYREVLTRLVKQGLAWTIIDCAEPLRQGDNYRTRNDAGQFLYSDNNHISYAGSELVGRHVVAEWKRLMSEEGESAPAAPEPVAP